MSLMVRKQLTLQQLCLGMFFMNARGISALQISHTFCFSLHTFSPPLHISAVNSAQIAWHTDSIFIVFC